MNLRLRIKVICGYYHNQTFYYSYCKESLMCLHLLFETSPNMNTLWKQNAIFDFSQYNFIFMRNPSNLLKQIENIQRHLILKIFIEVSELE